MVVGGLEEPWDIGRCRGGAGRRQLLEERRPRELERRPVGIGEDDQPGGPERRERLGELPPAGGELRLGGGEAAGLHTRAAVEDDDRRVGPSAAGER